MELIKNMLVLILYCLIITANLIPESKTANNIERTYDVNFLRSLNSVIDDINTWVFHEYPEELRVTLLDKHEIWVLSTPYEDELHFKIKKGSALEYLKEMFDTLECFHSLLTYNLFRLIKVYYREKRRNPGAPINITLWDFYKYVHRMQAVFSYGKFDVQQWQSDIYSRLKEMENIESLDDFVADSKLQEDKDEKLIITMTEFAYLCQKKHYLPQSECINRVIRKPLLTQTYFNWLSCKMNVPCVRSLEGEVIRNIFRLPEEEMEEREKLILEGLQSSRTEMGFLESQTSDSTKLVENKNEFRLYASKFGRVCKPGPQVTPSSVLKYILLADYSESDAMRYEKTHKIMGIKSFQDETKLKVMPCGEFVDHEFSYLAARPDGLVGDDGIVIVKCLNKAKDVPPIDSINRGITQFFHAPDGESNDIRFRTNSDSYHQVQGQLHVTQKEYCYFVVWNPSGLFYTKVNRDDGFWENEMKKELDYFYENYLLPELFYPQYVSTYNRYVIRK